MARVGPLWAGLLWTKGNRNAALATPIIEFPRAQQEHVEGRIRRCPAKRPDDLRRDVAAKSGQILDLFSWQTL
jgi:hypothetical protein